MRALGLDLGTRRIGVAVSDSEGTVATGVDTLTRSPERTADHRAVAALVEEWRVEVVVVGLPLSLDGTTGPAARAALDEAGQLAAVLRVPVVTHDERLTTVMAHDRLRRAGLGTRKRRPVVDRTAAAIILQGWLDRRRSNGDAGTPA